MTRAQVVALLAGAGALAMIVELVRRQSLRAKYAGLWLVVGVGIAVLAVFPGLLDRVAGLLDVADPPNLLFFVAILVLLAVIVQLSLELSRVEEHVRTLAEEVAMLRHDREPDAPVDETDPSTDPGA